MSTALRRGSRALMTAAAVVAGVLLLTVMAPSALGQTEETRLGGKVRAGGEVIVPADETVPGDLYLTGGTIRVEGDVEGDLVAAGGQIQVNGAVGGDALLAGGNVGVAGEVSGSTRVAGGQVLLTGQTVGDAAVASGRVRVGEGATIGQDLLFTAGEVQVDGAVAGDVLGSAGAYDEAGEVGGTTEVTVRDPEPAPTLAERILDRVQRYVALLIVGALLLWLAPRLTRRAAGHIRRSPLADLGAGALGLVVALASVVALVVVAVLVAVLLGLLGLGGLAGLSVGAAVVAAAAVVLGVIAVSAFMAPVLVALWLGSYAVDLGRGWAVAFGAAAVGLLVLVAVATIPVVGGIVALLVALLGIGALARLALRRSRGGTAAQPAEAAYRAP